MKFSQGPVLLLGMSLLSLFPVAGWADANAVSMLKDAIGPNYRALECQIQESGKYRPAPPLVELQAQKSSQSGDDVIFATAEYDGAKYSVDSDRISNDVLVISMSNDIDGPHSEDKLEIPVSELNRLKTDPNGKIHGSDHYYEDEDGTSSILKMTCELE